MLRNRFQAEPPAPCCSQSFRSFGRVERRGAFCRTPDAQRANGGYKMTSFGSPAIKNSAALATRAQRQRCTKSFHALPLNVVPVTSRHIARGAEPKDMRAPKKASGVRGQQCFGRPSTCAWPWSGSEQGGEEMPHRVMPTGQRAHTRAPVREPRAAGLPVGLRRSMRPAKRHRHTSMRARTRGPSWEKPPRHRTCNQQGSAACGPEPAGRNSRSTTAAVDQTPLLAPSVT